MADWADELNHTFRGGLGKVEAEYQAPTKFIKLKRGERRAIIILSESFWGGFFHFVEGRSLPCLAQGCKFCAQGSRARWRYIVEIMTVTGKERMLLELGKRHGKVLEKMIEEFGTLRGVMCTVERIGDGDNAAVAITRYAHMGENGIPYESDWVLRLCKMWMAQLKENDGNKL